MDKRDWLSLSGWGAITALSMWGAYKLGIHYQEHRHVPRATVKCKSNVQFEYRVASGGHTFQLICEPGRPVEIRDTAAGAILLR